MPCCSPDIALRMAVYAGAGLAAYLLGAIPFGLLVARCKGVDIRTVGSRNIGATNVFRSVGKGPGILTFLLDALKGLVPALLFPVIATGLAGLEFGQSLGLCCGVLAIAGHTWPAYLGFRGGKGVATSLGVVIGLAPAAAGCGVAAWLLVFLALRYVSVASIAAAVVAPLSAWYFYLGQGAVLPAAFSLLGLLIIWRHRGNIRRLREGRENRFSFSRKHAAPAAPEGH